MFNSYSYRILAILFIIITALFSNSCTKDNTFDTFEDKGCWGIKFPTFDWQHIESNDDLILEVSCDNFVYSYNTIEQVEIPDKIYTTRHYYPNGVYYWRIVEKSTGNILETNELHYTENSGNIFDGIYLITRVDSNNCGSCVFPTENETCEIEGGASCGIGMEIITQRNHNSYRSREYGYNAWDIGNSKIVDDVLEIDIVESEYSSSFLNYYPGKLKIYLNDNNCRMHLEVNKETFHSLQSYGLELRKI